MVDARVKPYLQSVAEADRRMKLRLRFRRNQWLGLAIMAVLILVWRLFHSHLNWLFPAGWWRL